MLRPRRSPHVGPWSLTARDRARRPAGARGSNGERAVAADRDAARRRPGRRPPRPVAAGPGTGGRCRAAAGAGPRAASVVSTRGCGRSSGIDISPGAGSRSSWPSCSTSGRRCGRRPVSWPARCAARTPAASGARCSCGGSSSWPAWSPTATSPSRRRCASGLRPDLIVTLPGGSGWWSTPRPRSTACSMPRWRRMPRLAGRTSPLTRRALRGHVTELARRAYAAELPDAPELVVLFLPGEHLYGRHSRPTRRSWRTPWPAAC